MSRLIRPGLIKPGDREFERWRQTHPPMAGGAGWSLGQPFQSATGSVAGTTGRSLAITGGVTAGQLVVAMGVFTSSTAGLLFTISDTSANVTSWNQNQANDVGIIQYLEIAWGIATVTGACTPKITISSASSTVLELVVASFNVPVGAPAAQDGALASAVVSAATTSVTQPTGNGGASNNDLVLNVVGTGGSFTTYNAPWTTGANTGDGYGYIINSGGNIANNATTTSGGYISMTVAVQVAALLALPAFQPHRMPLGV